MNTTTTPPKLEELVLYVASRSKRDEQFDLAKLNRILFFADFWSYTGMGRSITGEEYRERRDGPMPGGLPRALRALRRTGALEVRSHRPIALREPDVEGFTEAELACVDETIERLWAFRAPDVTSFPPA